ncbi:hypothetical protein BD770DRAFT_457393 [Pilaira anomala]|nr:hypothetical protein BD770DRAFT_457393 [Pilaira anomala]
MPSNHPLHPLLKNLFHINDEIVSIKVEETVLSGSTYTKAALYQNHNNIISFKVEIRILFDIDEDKFDMLQLSGRTCFFYTCHNSLFNNYHINVPQFSITFPSTFSQLGGFFSATKRLFMFRSSVEKLAHRLDNCVRTRLDRRK